MTACKWDSIIPLEPMWEELKRVIKPNGAIVLFGSEPFSSHLRLSNLKMFKYDWIYQKSCSTNFLNANKQPLRNHEMVSVFYGKQASYNPQKKQGKPYKTKRAKGKGLSQTSDPKIINGRYETISDGGRYPLSILDKFPKDKIFHPTQKPVALLEYLIKTYTNENETVLDFTAGSMSTAIACINTNRKGIMIEKDDYYFKVGSDRVAQALREQSNNNI